MLSVGWVMFWKAIAVAVWIALVVRYRAMKARRREQGIALRYDSRRNLYFDPLERLETRLKVAAYIVGAALAVYAALVLYLILTA